MQKCLFFTTFGILLLVLSTFQMWGYDQQTSEILSINTISNDGIIANISDGNDYRIQLKYTQIALLVCAVAFMLVSIYTFLRIRLIRKQKQLIYEHELEVEKQRNIASLKRSEAEQSRKAADYQKYLADQKNTEILSFTKQAQNLQNALLSNVNGVKKFYEESMVIYQPENFISSLLYWIQNRGALTVFVIANTNVEGVNGAILSISCINALNHFVQEEDFSNPKETIYKIQALLDGIMVSNLGQKPTHYEFSICMIDETTQLLHYTGELNFLCIHRYASDTWEDLIFETKGKNHKNKVSRTSVSHKDAIYMMNSDMRNFLSEVSNRKAKINGDEEANKWCALFSSKNLNEQKIILEDLIEEKGYSQLKNSDLCLLAIRLSSHRQHPFTKRELEVINYISEGLNSKDIAEKMFVSKHTVDTHRRRILKKIDAKNSAEVIRYCREIRVLV